MTNPTLRAKLADLLAKIPSEAGDEVLKLALKGLILEENLAPSVPTMAPQSAPKEPKAKPKKRRAISAPKEHWLGDLWSAFEEGSQWQKLASANGNLTFGQKPGWKAFQALAVAAKDKQQLELLLSEWAGSGFAKFSLKADGKLKPTKVGNGVLDFLKSSEAKKILAEA